MQQLAFFETDQVRPSTLKTDSTTTFADNLSAPVHRWFRYSAGFSAAWVREVIEAQRVWGRVNIYDPFAGSGTTLL
jgi:DNA modification methylase